MTEQEQRSPEEIREEIEETRRELGDTAAELAAKTDVKAQAKAKVEGAKESAREKKEELFSRAEEATPESVGAGASRAVATAKENPVRLAVAAAFGTGILIGWIIRR
jgi:hypothetical protein